MENSKYLSTKSSRSRSPYKSRISTLKSPSSRNLKNSSKKNISYEQVAGQSEKIPKKLSLEEKYFAIPPPPKVPFIDLFLSKTLSVEMTNINGNIEYKNFYFIKLLGKGAFGFTFLVLDNEINKLYAVKIIDEISAKQEIDCLKLVKEVCGEYILCYIGDFDQVINKTKYKGIVSDYEENLVDLRSYIQKRKTDGDPLSQTEKKTIMKNLLIGLNLITSINIAHNDLHIGNVLINIGEGDKNGNIKIIDFGLCSTQSLEETIKINSSWKRNFEERLND
jgi:hypothetical protein